MKSESLEKFRTCFADMAVYKDLRNNNFFSTFGLPSFMRDWLLQKYQDDDGSFNPEEIGTFVNRYLPRREGWFSVKDRIVNDGEVVKILAKIQIDININTSEISFSLPDYGLVNKETMIESYIWDRYKEGLYSGQEIWALLELGYRQPDDSARPKLPGKIRLESVSNFCPYIIDVDYYKEAAAQFQIGEWLDILLGAVDYNPSGYEIAASKDSALPEVETMKRTFLSRLLPFLEKRLNLIELAPKGTGKSYVFGHLSRYGWLSTSDRLTRAKLFYDQSKRNIGLVGNNDFLALDEIQKTIFDDGLGATLQAYLEQGVFTAGNFSGSSDCGMMLCGNIAPELMEADGRDYMFNDLPHVFHDPALIDRFHGFIKGWHVPRMNDDLKISGWALNSEYFTSILHELRNDGSYRAIIDEIVEVPRGADTRDTEAIKRIATAFLKLFFPYVRSETDVKASQFDSYCLAPAKSMRLMIKRQLSLMDKQYKWHVPPLTVKKSLYGCP